MMHDRMMVTVLQHCFASFSFVPFCLHNKALHSRIRPYKFRGYKRPDLGDG